SCARRSPPNCAAWVSLSSRSPSPTGPAPPPRARRSAGATPGPPSPPWSAGASPGWGRWPWRRGGLLPGPPAWPPPTRRAYWAGWLTYRPGTPSVGVARPSQIIEVVRGHDSLLLGRISCESAVAGFVERYPFHQRRPGVALALGSRTVSGHFGVCHT